MKLFGRNRDIAAGYQALPEQPQPKAPAKAKNRIPLPNTTPSKKYQSKEQKDRAKVQRIIDSMTNEECAKYLRKKIAKWGSQFSVLKYVGRVHYGTGSSQPIFDGFLPHGPGHRLIDEDVYCLAKTPELWSSFIDR